MIVSQGCADRLGLKEEVCIAYMLTIPNNTLTQERKSLRVSRLTFKVHSYAPGTFAGWITLQCAPRSNLVSTDKGRSWPKEHATQDWQEGH